MSLKELGKRIRRARTKSRISQEALASVLGKSHGWVSLLERGRSWPATLELRGGQSGGREGVKARTLHKYQVASGQRDQPGLRLQPVGSLKLAKDSASFSELLPAESLTIFSTYNLGHSARGILAQ